MTESCSWISAVRCLTGVTAEKIDHCNMFHYKLYQCFLNVSPASHEDLFFQASLQWYSEFNQRSHVLLATCGWSSCCAGYPSKTHLKLKSRGISLVHNTHFSCPIVLEFRTEHGSMTAMLCANFQNDWAVEKYGKTRFHLFELNMRFEWISYNAQVSDSMPLMVILMAWMDSLCAASNPL